MKKNSGLSGGGARARKKARRALRTTADVKRAFASCSRKLGWRGGNIEDASFQVRDQIYRYKERIVPGSVRTIETQRGPCAYFITKARGTRMPAAAREAPYSITQLCKGGCELTSNYRHRTLKEATSALARLMKSKPRGSR